MIGFDYTDRIPPAALRAAGCSVVFRYTTWSGWGKSLTPGEADELHAAGIPIAANFESTADRMKGGAAAGHADAVEARGHLGDDHLPTNLKVWFSADWDVQPGEVSLVLDYLHAAADVLGSKDLVGLYGGLRAVKAAADAGFGIWQTVAWSGGQWDPRAVARQTGRQLTVGGVQVDENEIINLAGLGAWGGPTTGGTDMGTYQVSAGWQHDYPDVAAALQAKIPAGIVVDETQAAAYSMIRSFVAAERTATIEAKLDQLLSRAADAPGVDINALEAAIVAGLLPHLTGNVDVPALAAALAPAVVAHLGLQVVAK